MVKIEFATHTAEVFDDLPVGALFILSGSAAKKLFLKLSGDVAWDLLECEECEVYPQAKMTEYDATVTLRERP